MELLKDVLGAGLVATLVIPGFVFVAIRSLLRGPRGTQDTELSSRIATSIVVSVLFNAVYLIAGSVAIGEQAVSGVLTAGQNVIVQSPVGVGVAVLVLGILIPAASAVLLYYRPLWRPLGEPWPTWLKYPVRRGGYRNFPTAWDRAAPGLGGTFVRIRLPEGNWVGGWYSGESFISTYPQPRDIYIEKQYVMSDSGQFLEAIPTSAGVWLGITDRHIVEWIAAETITSEEARS